MEKKPVTDLVLLPSLELIPTESLSTGCSEELALLKMERERMLGPITYIGVITFVVGVWTGLIAWATLLSWYGHVSFWLLLLNTVLCAVFPAGLSLLVPRFVSDVRKYRQKAIPPQLKADAKAELILSDAAKRLNWRITEWNMDAAEAMQPKVDENLCGCAEAAQHNIDERLCLELRKHRKLLVKHGEDIKRRSEYLKRKR